MASALFNVDAVTLDDALASDAFGNFAIVGASETDDLQAGNVGGRMGRPF